MKAFWLQVTIVGQLHILRLETQLAQLLVLKGARALSKAEIIKFSSNYVKGTGKAMYYQLRILLNQSRILEAENIITI